MMQKMDVSNLKHDETNRKIEGMQLSIDRLSDGQGEIESWKPQLEGKVTKLQNYVSDLKLKMNLFIHEIPKRSTEGEAKVEVPKAEASRHDCHHEEQY
ncbi:unnamed protein product [Urochloa humidicola]